MIFKSGWVFKSYPSFFYVYLAFSFLHDETNLQGLSGVLMKKKILQIITLCFFPWENEELRDLDTDFLGIVT